MGGKMSRKILGISYLLFSIISFGENTNKVIKLSDSVITTENFETTVRDTSANISIVTSQEIKDSGAKDLVDVLKNVPGIRVTRYAGTIKFDIRGLNSMYSDRNSLITLDGVPVSPSQISNLPLAMIDRVEVIPGGGNILYGDKAIGGVINILTKNVENKDFYGNIFGDYGSYNIRKYGFLYGAKITDKFLAEVAFVEDSNNGWREHEDFRNHSFNLKAKYLLENGEIEYKYTYNKDKNKLGVAVPRYISDNDRKNPGKISGSKYESNDNYLKISKNISSDTEFLIYGNYYYRKNSNFNRYAGNKYYGSFKRDGDDERKYVKAQIKHNYSPNGYFIVGMDYLDEAFKPYSVGKEYKKVTGLGENGKDKIMGYKNVQSGNSTKENFGTFFMNKYEVGKLQLSQGIRYDYSKYNFYWRDASLNNWNKIGTKDDSKYNNYSYELSANYLYSDTGSTYISYNRAFRTPTASEMRYTKNSEKLKPQVQDTIEIGLKDFLNDTYLSISTFYKKTHDEIYSAIPPEFSGMVNYNIGKTERVGFEGVAEHYIDKLTLKSSITYIKSKIVDGEYAGSEMPSVPNWKITGGLTYDFTEKFSTTFEGVYYSQSYDLDDLENLRGKNSGEYITFDLSAYYKITSDFMITGRIENIFDEKYDEYAGYWDDNYENNEWKFRRQYYPAIGRTLTIGISYTF